MILVGITISPPGFLDSVLTSIRSFQITIYLVIIILDSQTPRERVRRRARNTMAGMVNSALDRRLATAMEAMTDAEIRRLDDSTSRLGMDGNRIIELP